MNSKKAITLLVLTTLILSLTPIIITNAIDIDSVLDADYDPIIGSVFYSDIIIVTGTGATPGRNVNVYWDAIDDWDGESGLLNSTRAAGNGAWEVWFRVPEAVNGAHYISVENVRNGVTDTWTTPIDVGASLGLSPRTGLPNDVVTITGRGFGPEAEIESINFDGASVSTSPGTPKTNGVGTFTATFSVPSLAYSTYSVDAEDEDTNFAAVDFNIGAAITLNKVAGPSGTAVRVNGRGFTPGAFIHNGTVEYDGVACGIISGVVRVRTNGQFTIDLVIPDSGSTGSATLYVEEVDGVGNYGEATFNQNGRPAVELSPEYGPVGSTITVRGFNFTQINGANVVLSLDGSSPKTVTTNTAGQFTTTYRIPGASGTPNIVAAQADYAITASHAFRVGFITVVMFPDEVTAGARVTVSGSGFDPARTCDVTLNGVLWIDDVTVGSNGVITDTAHVPSMEAGTYTVVVTESVSEISVSVQLTITENTYVETNPLVAPAGYTVNIMGYNFAELPGNNDLTFVLYNETYELTLDVTHNGNSVVLGLDDNWDDGFFRGRFTLPPEDEIDIGTYMINVTDGEGLFAQMVFNVVDKTVELQPRKSVFRIGETVAFNVESSFAQPDSYIRVWDPAGNLYWQTDVFDEDAWVQVGTIQRVPYFEQVAGGNPMTLLEDAPLGTWEWTWYASDGDELDSGTFTVEEAAENVLANRVEDLANQLTDLSADIEGISGEFSDIQSNLNEVRSVAQQAVSAAQQAEQAIQTVAQTANQANQAASDAKQAAEAARDAANSLTTLVYGAIGAALVAALAAIVSLMQISRRIAG
jgi:hypothetical protein